LANASRYRLAELRGKILCSLSRLWGLALERKYDHKIKREWGEFQNLLGEYFAEVEKLFTNGRGK
jgi:hypothetical protein